MKKLFVILAICWFTTLTTLIVAKCSHVDALFYVFIFLFIASVIATIFIPLIAVKTLIFRALGQDDGVFVDCWLGKASGFKAMLQQAQSGNTVARFNVGFCYLVGKATRQDVAQAEEWFLKAANGGDGDAMFRLGEMYEDRSEYKKAVEMFRRGEDCSFKCKLRLARMFENGRGVPKNDAMAAALRLEAQYMSRDIPGFNAKFTTKNGVRQFTNQSERGFGYAINETYTIREDF